METLAVNSMSFHNAYQGKRVLVTGHTGFKGAWLCEWLLALGAEVTGFALPPATSPALFDQLGLAERLRHQLGDVRDLAAVRQLVQVVKPQFVFHLAAQPLVRLSYEQPVETYSTNVMGTVNVLEAIRLARCACAMVIVTSDKCYENQEWVHGYREDDHLGGHDPYSSSKAAVEIVAAAYRSSYFSAPDSPVRVATARAGNVIGGGDWALDRIVPDCIRALQRSEAIPVRNKVATRPWQHVLEPLSGYLRLGECLQAFSLTDPAVLVKLNEYTSGFNFGPSLASNRSVADLVKEILRHWPGSWVDRSDPHAVHEATRLNLATDKAFHCLHWRPIWTFEETVARTVQWYRNSQNAVMSCRSLTSEQIEDYTRAVSLVTGPANS